MEGEPSNARRSLGPNRATTQVEADNVNAIEASFNARIEQDVRSLTQGVTDPPVITAVAGAVRVVRRHEMEAEKAADRMFREQRQVAEA